MRGRLPGFNSFGWFGVNRKLCMRDEIGMPVSPATKLGSHAPLGVAEKRFPCASITLTQVVSCARSASGISYELMLIRFDNDFLLIGSPGRCSMEAVFGSIKVRRIPAYSFDNNSAPGTFTKRGSP